MKILGSYDVPPIDLQYQKITEVREAKFEIADNCIRYNMVFYADEWKTADKELPSENVFNSFHITASKEQICGIEKTYISDLKGWKVIINVNGFAQEIRLYYKNKAKATEMYNRLSDYKYGEIEPCPLNQ